MIFENDFSNLVDPITYKNIITFDVRNVYERIIINRDNAFKTRCALEIPVAKSSFDDFNGNIHFKRRRSNSSYRFPFIILCSLFPIQFLLLTFYFLKTRLRFKSPSRFGFLHLENVRLDYPGLIELFERFRGFL